MYLDAKDYKKLAVRTMSDQFHIASEAEMRMLHCSIGVITELGEILEATETRQIDRVNLGEEIADCFWYLSEFERAYEFEADNQPYTVDCEHVSLDASAIITDTVVEASELLDVFKKRAFYGKDFNSKHVCELVTMIYSNLARLANGLGLDIGQIRYNNIEKLKARFPEKFTSQDAIERDLEKEREILEK